MPVNSIGHVYVTGGNVFVANAFDVRGFWQHVGNNRFGFQGKNPSVPDVVASELISRHVERE